MLRDNPIKHPVIKRETPMIFILITLHLIEFSLSSNMIQISFEKNYIKTPYMVKVIKNKGRMP